MHKKLSKALLEQSIARIQLDDGESICGFIRDISEDFFEFRCRSYVANNLHLVEDDAPADLVYKDRLVHLGTIVQVEADSGHSLLPDQLNGLLFHKKAIAPTDWRGKDLKGTLKKKEEEETACLTIIAPTKFLKPLA